MSIDGVPRYISNTARSVYVFDIDSTYPTNAAAAADRTFASSHGSRCQYAPDRFVSLMYCLYNSHAWMILPVCASSVWRGGSQPCGTRRGRRRAGGARGIARDTTARTQARASSPTSPRVPIPIDLSRGVLRCRQRVPALCSPTREPSEVVRGVRPSTCRTLAGRM